LDAGFDPGLDGGTVYGVAIQPDGKLIICGAFTTIQQRIARLHPDGTLDPAFNPGSSANNTIGVVALQPDGKMLIGGWFTSFRGVARNRIARLNSDGTLDTSFDPGTGADTVVGADTVINSIAVQDDGKIIIAGGFRSFNGVPRNRIARLNHDGTLDSSFNPSGPSGSGGSTLWREPGGGFVTSSSGSPPWLREPGIEAIVLQSDGNLLVAGNFDAFNGVPSANVARLLTGGEPPQTAEVALTVTRSGAQVMISWPVADSAGYVLESATSLVPAANWTRESSVPAVAGDQHVLSLKPEGTARFYRLRKE
jgi:uncharacterized delta-60 repeat protein